MTGFVVLSVADRPDDEFTLTWLVKQVESTKPQEIEINSFQQSVLSAWGPEGLEPYKTFRDIPLRLVDHSFFGVKK